MTVIRPGSTRFVLVLVLAGSGLAACTVAAGASSPPLAADQPPTSAQPLASTPPAASVPAMAEPSLTPPPAASGPGSAGGGSGSEPGQTPAGGSDGTVTVTAPPGSPAPVPPTLDPTLVEPTAGVLDPRPVGAQRLSATVEGDHIIVRLEWVSGVAPCSVLSGVSVSRSGDTFTLTIREGPLSTKIACIDIAMAKATLVDLGPVQPGSYVIRAVPGEASPVTVTVP